MMARVPTAINPQKWGYRPVYRRGAYCPGCGSTAWHRGRHVAECARCATALPIALEDERHG